MSYEQLLKHLKKDCKLLKLKCVKCGASEQRGKWKRHMTKTCVKNLSEK